MIILIFKLYAFYNFENCVQDITKILEFPRKQIMGVVNLARQQAMDLGLVGVKIGQTIYANGRSYKITKLLGKGKGGYAYLAEDGNAKVVVKQIHYEKVSHYTFESNKLSSELRDYHTLLKFNIPMPKLLYYDQLRQILIKEYIEGESLTTIIVKDQLTIDHVQQIVDMRDALYPYLNIDYYPTNFIFKKGKLYYVDYECNHYDYEYSFENWGIYFLVNPKGWQAVLERGDYSLLMKNNKPIKTGFEDIAARWLYDANRSYIDMRRRY